MFLIIFKIHKCKYVMIFLNKVKYDFQNQLQNTL